MEPDSLFYLSLEAGCHVDPCAYRDLPSSLKEKILIKLTKRGHCSSSSLINLIQPDLIELDLRDCSISQESLLCLKGLNRLKGLFLPQPPSVSADAFSEAALVEVIRGKPALLSLGMSGLCGVNDRVVGVMVGGSPDLVEVNLEKTPITNQALFCLANLSSLQCLNIARTQINDAGLEQLACGSAGQSLVELRLNGCRKLTQHSIKTLLSSSMSRLNILTFHLCPNLSAEDISEELRNRRIKQLTWTVY